MHNKEELQKYIEKRIRETGIGTPTTEAHIQSGIVKFRTEKDSISVQMVRIAAVLMRVIKKRSNSLSLTTSGKELMKSDSLLSRRVFYGLSYHLGLVTIDESGRFTPDHTKLIRRTPLFDTLFTIKNT